MSGLMPRERWRLIRGYGHRYQISDRGRVLSFAYGRKTILKTPLNFYDKPCVCLSRNGWTQTHTIASLVKNVFGK